MVIDFAAEGLHKKLEKLFHTEIPEKGAEYHELLSQVWEPKVIGSQEIVMNDLHRENPKVFKAFIDCVYRLTDLIQEAFVLADKLNGAFPQGQTPSEVTKLVLNVRSIKLPGGIYQPALELRQKFDQDETIQELRSGSSEPRKDAGGIIPFPGNR